LPDLRSRYLSMVAAGQIEADAAQAAAIERLHGLSERLSQTRLARKSNPLGWLFGGKAEKPQDIRGLYIWGAVGRGKTMLMDLFFSYVTAQRKRRVHFHDFMAEVHGRVHAFRQRTKDLKARNADPIPVVADQIAEEAWVLCFDEFAVNDIADAMILGRLFSALWERGVIVVATSNVDPQNLYLNGLNRALFLPFIAELQARMDVLKLDARTDYRLEKLAGAPTYHHPADAGARAALDAAFLRLTAGVQGRPATLTVRTRKVDVPLAAAGVARFSFPDLCDKPLGASDYLMIARDFHTVVLDGVPVLNHARRNEAKRFITLIDVLYEHRVKLVISAEAAPHKLYHADEGAEAFEFDRTVSRLTEMQSDAYLGLPHGRPTGAANLGGIVET
jgi:cell division protein ZapE